MGDRLLVVLDVDGTLIDNSAPILAATIHAFEREGLPVPPRATILDTVGLSMQEMMETLAPEGTQAGIVHKLIRRYDRHFDGQARRGLDDPPFAGADGFLDALASMAGVRTALATGKSRRSLDRVLATRGWEGRFAAVQTAESGASKPAPDMLQRILDGLGYAAAEAVMVGDSRHDMGMARAAGVRGLGVTWGYGAPETLRRAGADRLVASFDEVLALAREMLG
jgi:phosphoglycolate phosphatase